jgi:hypothetical protein
MPDRAVVDFVLRESWGESAADFGGWEQLVPGEQCPYCGLTVERRARPTYDEDGEEVDAVFCENCGLGWLT